MLELFKDKVGEVKDPESFFNHNLKAFDMSIEDNKLVVQVMENATVEGNVLVTPMGKGRITDLKTATKLALCLINYTGFLFSAANVSVRDLNKILLLPRGSLYIELKEPFPYLFQVHARTGSGMLLSCSTDVNIWYFTGRK